MILTLTRDAFRFTRHTPLLWLLALLSGETGLVVVLFPLQSLSTSSLPLPHFALPLLLSLFALALLFWLFSALAIAALILTTARLVRHQSTHAPWLAALPYFWPLLTLRLLYLLTLALLLLLISRFASLPLVWIGVALAGATAGLLLNLAARALLLDPHPGLALRGLFARPWPLFKVWIGAQVLSLLILLSFLFLILLLEIIALVVLFAISQVPDPFFGLILLATGILVALPLLAFLAFAGAFVNSYWTSAYLTLRP
jgi:hypothetical protein